MRSKRIRSSVMYFKQTFNYTPRETRVAKSIRRA